MSQNTVELSRGSSHISMQNKIDDSKINFYISENLKIKISGVVNSIITMVEAATLEFRATAEMAEEERQRLHQRGYPVFAALFSSIRNINIIAVGAGFFICDTHKYGVSTAFDRMKTGEYFAPPVNHTSAHVAQTKLGGSAMGPAVSDDPDRLARPELKSVNVVDLREIAKSGVATLILLARNRVIKMIVAVAGQATKGVANASAFIQLRCKHQVLPVIKKGLLSVATRFNRLPTHR